MSFLSLPNEILTMIAYNLKSDQDLSAFSRASKQFYPAISPILYRNNIRRHRSSGLFWVAKHGEVTIAERSFECGANANVRGYQNRRPLQLAVEEGHVTVARIFLNHGAEFYKDHMPGFAPKAYIPALHGAVSQGSDDMVRLLLDHGADPNENLAWPFSALHMAIFLRPQPSTSAPHRSRCGY
jgi:ankyrin repeat protein